MEYWYAVAGRRFGPHSPAEFDVLLRTGQLPVGAWVYAAGSGRWMPVSEAVALYPPMTPAVTGWAPPPAWVAPSPMSPAMLVPLNSLAVTSFVLALVSIPLALVLVGFALAVGAVVLGHLAIRDIRRSREREQPQRGQPLAIAGLVIGYTMLAFCVLMIVAIAIPSSQPNPPRTPTTSTVQTDLRNAATAQDVVFAETQRYTESLGVLLANGFTPTSGAEFQISADADGYCMSAFRPGETTYHIESGSAPAPGPCREQLL